MADDVERLRAILVRFAHDPDDAALWPAARELADRFTLDQLCAMAASRAGEVRQLFDRILGRASPASASSQTRGARAATRAMLRPRRVPRASIT